MASYLSNGIQGAGTGAALGGATAGPIGAIIGGSLGGIAGLFSAWESEKDASKRRKILEQAANQYNTTLDNVESQFNEWYNDPQNGPIGTSEDKETYRNQVTTYDPNEFVYDFQPFENNYDVNDYYAPNKNAIIDATASKLQAAAVGSGLGRGTGMANQIATGVANKNEELYKDALQAMNQDRAFAYNVWKDNISNNQQRLDAIRQGKQYQTSLYGDLAQDFTDWNQNKIQQQMAMEKERANNNMQYALARASI